MDLSRDGREQFHAAVWDPAKAPPEGLKLTGYDPKAGTPGKPQNDPYPHDDFAKDNPRKNREAETRDQATGKTKFELAKEAAVRESKDLLDRVRRALSEQQWEGLIAADVPGLDHSRYAWVVTGPCGLTVVGWRETA